jgi:hypothetical protein
VDVTVAVLPGRLDEAHVSSEPQEKLGSTHVTVGPAIVEKIVDGAGVSQDSVICHQG